ncbi:unnamed protein product [Camellia sinensis]
MMTSLPEQPTPTPAAIQNARSVSDTKSPKQRLNFRSNISGLVNMMHRVEWTDLHLVHLMKTPFWLLFKAILKNQLPHTEFKKDGDMVVSIIQSYSVQEGKFVIGGQSVDFTDEDVRLLFGLQCGNAFLELTARPKPASDFVQQRCQGVSRITMKLVKDLLVEAAKGTTPRDYEDTAKLLCLYACVKLFFSTSGESVSWTFIRYVENLDAMKSYDWAGAIRNSLMSSIRDFHRTPHKVTGCVIALLYWLCEHTSIVEAKLAHQFPRFLKWNIGELLASARGVKLSEAVSFQVSPGQLVADEREINILKGEDMVGGEHVDLRDNGVHNGLGGVHLNESTLEITGSSTLGSQPNAPGPSAPVFTPLSFPMLSVEQIMAAQSDIEPNHYTLKSCVETMTAVTNLSHQFQNRTIEVQQLKAQLSLLQCKYKDARAEICALKAENKELKRKATVMFRFGGPPYATLEEQRGGNLLGGLGSTEGGPSSVAQDEGKRKRAAAEPRK